MRTRRKDRLTRLLSLRNLRRRAQARRRIRIFRIRVNLVSRVVIRMKHEKGTRPFKALHHLRVKNTLGFWLRYNVPYIAPLRYFDLVSNSKGWSWVVAKTYLVFLPFLVAVLKFFNEVNCSSQSNKKLDSGRQFHWCNLVIYIDSTGSRLEAQLCFLTELS